VTITPATDQTAEAPRARPQLRHRIETVWTRPRSVVAPIAAVEWKMHLGLKL
jgi:hypothetical protein